MKEVTKRILLAVLVIPILIVIIFFLPCMHNIALLGVLVLFTFIGTWEFVTITLKDNISRIGTVFSAFSGFIFPVLFYLQVNNWITTLGIEIALSTVFSIILVLNLIQYEKKEDTTTLKRLAVQISSVIYPGFFLGYLIKVTSLPHSSGLILLFLLVIFINDSAAYTFGMLFGRKSWKPFKVSPKKSIVGFIGGTVTAVVSGMVFIILFPEVLSTSLAGAALLSLILSVTANIGDLIESVLKRSAGVKDSGAIMMGRGGVLDSIDSLLFSAPMYYFMLHFLQ